MVETAQETELARGQYRAFFERNAGGITHVGLEPRTYYIRRGWAIRGPIPRGVRIEYVGLANARRAGHKKTGYRPKGMT